MNHLITVHHSRSEIHILREEKDLCSISYWTVPEWFEEGESGSEEEEGGPDIDGVIA